MQSCKLDEGLNRWTRHRSLHRWATKMLRLQMALASFHAQNSPNLLLFEKMNWGQSERGSGLQKYVIEY
jgi:hypothetical protein